MTDLEKVIRLVRKLLAKAGDAATTPEESAAFAAKANQMLLEHKLGLTEVQLRQEDEEEPIAKQHVHNRKVRKRSEWLEELAEAIAFVTFCRLIIHPPYSTITFVGKTSDRELASFLMETLADQAYTQGKKWANRMAREHQRRGERVPYRMLASYLAGFVQTVRSRLYDNYTKTQKQGGQYALVRFQGAREQVNNWYTEHGPKDDAKPIGDPGYDWLSMMKGAKDGEGATLHGGIQPPETTGKPTIQAARRQLGKGD